LLSCLLGIKIITMILGNSDSQLIVQHQISQLSIFILSSYIYIYIYIYYFLFMGNSLYQIDLY
ncbi:MAG: hypothetical protein N7Q72_07440, partial [Spiroplasma sp. Tabriz.8]|nr:hypothetical protein [Spiroplasma sp. Tabriz.8]